MKKESRLKQTFRNNLYIMKLAWNLCPSRVIFAGLDKLCSAFDYIFFNAIFLKYIVQLLERKADYKEIMIFVIGTAILFLVTYLFQGWYKNYLISVAGTKVYKGLYKSLYAKACSVELSCFEDSEFYNRYILAAENCDKRVSETIENTWGIIVMTFFVGVTWYLMLQVDPLLIFFVAGPLLGNFYFAEKMNQISYRVYEESAVFKRIADYINRVMHLSDYAKELRMTNIFHVMRNKQNEAVKGMADTMDKYAKKSILHGWGYLFFTFSVVFEGVLFYGAYRTIYTKTIEFTDFVVISGLMTAVSWNLIDLAGALVSSFKNSLYIQQLRDFLEYEPKIPESQKGIIPEKEIREIRFENVSFAYKQDKPVLKNISFTISTGVSCALVGYNGAGKTTLIKLLLRFYDPSQGHIYVNGIDIREYDLKKYRELFATAFQDGRLFAKSIKDNILMGEDWGNASETILQSAMKAAGINDKVETLKKGTDTMMTKEFDEEGVILSGGQNQKILAARAFAKTEGMNCPILIFDEPSSALDPIAEHELMEQIKLTGRKRILFLISHRLSSMHDMDKVLLLKNGHLAEMGTHHELMAAGGEYADLYHMQAQKYKKEEQKWRMSL